MNLVNVQPSLLPRIVPRVDIDDLERPVAGDLDRRAGAGEGIMVHVRREGDIAALDQVPRGARSEGRAHSDRRLALDHRHQFGRRMAVRHHAIARRKAQADGEHPFLRGVARQDRGLRSGREAGRRGTPFHLRRVHRRGCSGTGKKCRKTEEKNAFHDAASCSPPPEQPYQKSRLGLSGRYRYGRLFRTFGDLREMGRSAHRLNR